ncbi:hypothetical protein EQG79_30150 [Spirosoma sordidisoli]|uniref:Uncharacterized protein n=1 Tax=Spirosoma sordidisoli TaxID=2502893 RepID=A0A4V1RVD0_9BACT|nr:hypothetical protein EQG79_30150 [Spirosoma sordidisoli]
MHFRGKSAGAGPGTPTRPPGPARPSSQGGPSGTGLDRDRRARPPSGRAAGPGVGPGAGPGW